MAHSAILYSIEKYGSLSSKKTSVELDGNGGQNQALSGRQGQVDANGNVVDEVRRTSTQTVPSVSEAESKIQPAQTVEAPDVDQSVQEKADRRYEDILYTTRSTNVMKHRCSLTEPALSQPKKISPELEEDELCNTQHECNLDFASNNIASQQNAIPNPPRCVELRNCALGSMSHSRNIFCSIKNYDSCSIESFPNELNDKGGQNQALEITRQGQSDVIGNDLDEPSTQTSPPVSKPLSNCDVTLPSVSAFSGDAPSTNEAVEDTVGDLSVHTATKQNQGSTSDVQSGKEILDVVKDVSTSAEFDEPYVFKRRSFQSAMSNSTNAVMHNRSKVSQSNEDDAVDQSVEEKTLLQSSVDAIRSAVKILGIGGTIGVGIAIFVLIIIGIYFVVKHIKKKRKYRLFQEQATNPRRCIFEP